MNPAIVYDRSGDLHIGFDIKTMATIMSLNLGLSTADMSPTQSAYPSSVKMPPGQFYIHPQLVPMYPFYCLDEKKGPPNTPGADLCFYILGGTQAGQTIFYPISASLNYNNYTASEFCQCPKSAFVQACNDLDIMIGLFYDKSGNDTNTIEFGERMRSMLLADPMGDVNITSLIYPLFSLVSQSYSDASNLAVRAQVKRAIRAINPTVSTFAAVMFETASYGMFTALNKYNLQGSGLLNRWISIEPSEDTWNIASFSQTMCQNYLYLPDALTRMQAYRPVQLVYNYYECHLSLWSAVKADIGW